MSESSGEPEPKSLFVYKAGQQPVLIRTENLSKLYGDNAQRVYALDQVNLSVAEGEMVAVMGPSGSGKSTLLNMLGALDRPSSGSVCIDGEDLSTVKDVDSFRARMVGFVFQLHNLIPTLTAIENIEVPMRGLGVGATRRRARAKELLDLVGLSQRARHVPAQLSGGQRQRVAIARALANSPRLILADEPTGNLDSTSGEEIMQLLATLNHEQRTTIVVVTHDRHVARATQRILRMSDGRIVEDHAVQDPLTEDLRDLAQSEFGRRLVDGDTRALSELALVRDGNLTTTAEQLAALLRQLL